MQVCMPCVLMVVMNLEVLSSESTADHSLFPPPLSRQSFRLAYYARRFTMERGKFGDGTDAR